MDALPRAESARNPFVVDPAPNPHWYWLPCEHQASGCLCGRCCPTLRDIPRLAGQTPLPVRDHLRPAPRKSKLWRQDSPDAFVILNEFRLWVGDNGEDHMLVGVPVAEALAVGRMAEA